MNGADAARYVTLARGVARLGGMDDEYFEALRRTGDAWEAYCDAAQHERGDGRDVEGVRSEALWARFQQCVIKLATMRENRRRG